MLQKNIEKILDSLSIYRPGLTSSHPSITADHGVSNLMHEPESSTPRPAKLLYSSKRKCRL